MPKRKGENMKITNIEKLNAFLDDNFKMEYDFNEVLKDIERDEAQTGSKFYELKGWETKSGNPEIIYYDVVTRYLVDGEWISEQEYFERDLEEFDDYEKEFIF